MSYITDEAGTRIMLFHNQFNLWARKHNMENPFEKARAILRPNLKEVNGKHYVEPLDEDVVLPDEKECMAWLKAENAFVALRIYEKIGYERFVKYCSQHDIDDLVNKVLPCGSRDNNCHIYCKYYGLNCEELCGNFFDMSKVLLEYLEKAG